MLASIDWTNVLIAVIAGLPSIIAAVFAGLVHGQVKTPSGKSLGQVAEYAHDTAIANNMLLRKHNGPTKGLDKETARVESETPPQVPVNQEGK